MRGWGTTVPPHFRQNNAKICRQIPLYPKPIIRFGSVCTAAKGTRFGACSTSWGVDVIQEPGGIFILKMDIAASGTLLRVGTGRDDFCAIENLAVGDEVFDPIEERLVEITEIACVTLDSETVRDRGFSPKALAGDTSPNPLIYAVKVPVTLAREGYTPPIRGEYTLQDGTVFFALGFERRSVVETPSAFCEFLRPSAYAFESSARRSPTVLRSDTLPHLR